MIAGAFATDPGIDEKAVTPSVILAAQHKFIRPALGKKLYERLGETACHELLRIFIKPALALYVRLMLLPTLAASAGNLGIVQPKGQHFSPADSKSVASLRKQARSEAGTMMLRAIRHVEENPARYPDYDRMENILNRVSISSQIVL
mgnify:CR=1 FL=1